MQDRIEDNIKKSIIRLAPQIFNKQPVLFGYLFGSFATGCSHTFSDIDIAVYTEGITPVKSLELELLLSLKFDKKLNCKSKSEVRIINNLLMVVNKVCNSTK